jgi:arylsulfatase A-like enzyme
MGTNAGEFGCNVPQIPDSSHLLSRRLQNAGYLCGYTGKWHLGTEVKNAALPSNRGFVGMNVPGHGDGGHHSKGYKNYLKEHNLKHNLKPGKRFPGSARFGVETGPPEASVPHYLAEHTISLIDSFAEKDSPFFIWHNNWGPHEPYYVPQKFFDMYKDVTIPEWETYRWKPDNPYGPDQMKRAANSDDISWQKMENIIKHYYAFTTFIDYEIGRILKHLEDKGIADNTIIIFSSDHGETLGSHGGMIDKGFSHFEEIQHIGMIIKDPAATEKQKGKREEKFTSLVDIYPTILDYAKAEYDKNTIHGRSMVDLVHGKPIKWRDSVFVEFFGIGNAATNMVTCRYKDYKYGYTCSNKDELYDLAKDPHETINLLDDPDYADVVEMMRKRIYTFMQRTKYPARNYFPGTRLVGYSDHIIRDMEI